MTAAYREGYEAFRAGVRWIDNPHAPGSEQEEDWDIGWNDARTDSYVNSHGPIADEYAP